MLKFIDVRIQHPHYDDPPLPQQESTTSQSGLALHMDFGGVRVANRYRSDSVLFVRATEMEYVAWGCE